MSRSGARIVLTLGILSCPITLFWLWIGMALHAGLNSPMSASQERLVWAGTAVLAVMLVLFLIRAARGPLPLGLRVGAGILGAGVGGLGLYLVSADGRNWLVFVSAIIGGICLLIIAAESSDPDGDPR